MGVGDQGRIRHRQVDIGDQSSIGSAQVDPATRTELSAPKSNVCHETRTRGGSIGIGYAKRIGSTATIYARPHQ
jgi:hypothetical protein